MVRTRRISFVPELVFFFVVKGQSVALQRHLLAENIEAFQGWDVWRGTAPSSNTLCSMYEIHAASVMNVNKCKLKG